VSFTVPISASSRQANRKSVAALSGNVQISVPFPASSRNAILQSYALILNLFHANGTSSVISPDSSVSSTANVVSASVDSRYFAGATSWNGVIQVVSPIFHQPPPGISYLSTPGWGLTGSLDPSKRTLVFIHGIASSIASTYPPGCANSIVFRGGYDQAIGYDYDWTDPPKVAGPAFQAAIDRLGLRSIDIEAHSYGTVVALQALPNLRTPVKNMVLLAGPLPRGGTPAATYPPFFRDFVLREFLHVDPGAVQRAENKGMLASIVPQSQDLADITKSILPLAGSAPEFVEAGGTRVPPELQDEVFVLPFLAGFNDGLIPLTSALSTDFDSFAPQNFRSLSFDVDHGHIVCDSSVQAFVAQSLVRSTATPGPPVTPTPVPPATETPVPPPATQTPVPPATQTPAPPPTQTPSPPATQTPSVTPTPVPSDTPGAVSEFPIPLNNPNNITDNRPNGITAGRDLALWFTFGSVAVPPTIGRMTTDGHFTKYALSASETQPWGIVAGSDGALWFTEVSTNKIGRMSTSGQLLQEFTIPTPTSYPYGLVFGSDGALWFIECRAGANKVGRMTMSGQFQEFPVNAGINGTPEKITAGQGVLWFTESDAGRIGRINIDGTGYQDYFIGNGAVGHGIAFGPDGALWFTARDFATIGRLTTSGQYTPYPIGFGVQPQEIAYGPDGAMWFTLYDSIIGRVTTSGQFNGYSVPQTDSHPFAITVGPDAALWFTDNGGEAKQIGRIATSVSHRLNGRTRQPTGRR